jgi:hypothetical protein
VIIVFAPWNVRVSRIGRPGSLLHDWFKAEVRIGGRWFDAGVARTKWKAFWMGVLA